MNLASEYRKQFGWRDWPGIFDALPPLQGQVILDLGSGVGDQAAELAARGARVIGIDMSEELLREAESKDIANAKFLKGDVRTPPDPGEDVDGIWCSFAAAYFPDLPAALAIWKKLLRPGGWIALTEIDDLFGHEPLGARPKSLFGGYARDALAAGRYDFHMGRKLGAYAERAGFKVSKVLTIADQEFSFTGPALPDVIEAWRNRFDRMTLLRDFCGAEFEPVREEFLACLSRADHRARAQVCFCLAVSPDARTP